MEYKTIKAYKYYKNADPRFLILFHILNRYEAFQDDADLLAALTGKPAENRQIDQETIFRRFIFPEKEILSYMSLFSKNGIPSKTITQINDKGEPDIPDVDQIEDDKKIDY